MDEGLVLKLALKHTKMHKNSTIWISFLNHSTTQFIATHCSNLINIQIENHPEMLSCTITVHDVWAGCCKKAYVEHPIHIPKSCIKNLKTFKGIIIILSGQYCVLHTCTLVSDLP
jgi:hypothetical protein